MMVAKGNSLGIVKRYLFESIGAAKYPFIKDFIKGYEFNDYPKHSLREILK